MATPEFNRNFRKALYNGIVIFLYKKQNGEIRKAIGTTHPGIIPASLNNDRNRKPLHEKLSDLINYFDLEKKDWRCFYLDKLEKTVSINMVKKEGQPSTFHITNEEKELAEINKAILRIEERRAELKNDLRRVRRNGSMFNHTIEDRVEQERETMRKKILELRKERKAINDKINKRIPNYQD